MDRERLERYLVSGMSLEEIGLLENRHPTTVSYWLKRYGLEPNGRLKHAAKGPIDKAVLEELIANRATIAEIAEAIERSPSATRYWLDRYGLKTRGRRGPRPIVDRELVDAASEAGFRTLEAKCPTHGPSVFVIETSGRVRCRKCRMQRVADRRRKNKWTLAEEAGGKCVRCGYDRFIGALQFHHRDRKTKRFGVSGKGSTRSLNASREEARKCDLLCANCHAEVEHGGANLSLE